MNQMNQDGKPYTLKSHGGTFHSDFERLIMSDRLPEVGKPFGPCARLRIDENGSKVLGVFGPTSAVRMVQEIGDEIHFWTQSSHYSLKEYKDDE